jgi:flagellar hook assembly protein FlgD
MDDVGNINYTFSEPGYRINIWIYNSSGFKVKQLVNNDLAAMEGTYSWDGTSEDNKKASTGIYVCYVEVWKLDGTVKRYKKPMTLGARYK